TRELAVLAGRVQGESMMRRDEGRGMRHDGREGGPPVAPSSLIPHPSSLIHERFTLLGLPAESRLAKFARDVAKGLTASPKHLPCCYFYDRLGSLLFEAICEVPE